jgi:hypothetical protein
MAFMNVFVHLGGSASLCCHNDKGQGNCVTWLCLPANSGSLLRFLVKSQHYNIVYNAVQSEDVRKKIKTVSCSIC